MVFTEDHAPLFTGAITNWKIAKKIKSIRAKQLISIVVDKLILSKLLVTTLEANEPLGDGVVICIGEAGDIWQQMPKSLLKKYTVASIDNEGWMVCDPKPDNSVECIQWTNQIITHIGEHYVKALWGEDFRTYGPCQRFSEGDYICRNREDKTDVWVVRKKLFENTYTIISSE